MSDPTEGWGLPAQSRKWHYFRQTMALCRKFGFYSGGLEAGDDLSDQNCAACKRALSREQRMDTPKEKP